MLSCSWTVQAPVGILSCERRQADSPWGVTGRARNGHWKVLSIVNQWLLVAPSSLFLSALLSSSHIRILDFSFDGGKEIVTKWRSNWSPGVTLSAFCTIFRAGPVWKGLGTQLGRKTVENRPKLKSSFYIMTATKFVNSGAAIAATATRGEAWSRAPCHGPRPRHRSHRAARPAALHVKTVLEESLSWLHFGCLFFVKFL
jgi:hypothetical protein